MTAPRDPMRDPGDGVVRAWQAQIDQFEPIAGGLPVANADRMGAGGQGRLQHEVRPVRHQIVQPLQHHPPGGQIAGRTCSGQTTRHLVGIDELERLRAFAQEAVDEGGLSGPVGSGEEDEGGHPHNLAASDGPVTRARAVEVLADDLHAAEVRAAEALWVSRGINGVPAVVVEGKWLISGGQPAGVFEEALRGMAGEL